MAQPNDPLQCAAGRLCEAPSFELGRHFCCKCKQPVHQIFCSTEATELPGDIQSAFTACEKKGLAKEVCKLCQLTARNNLQEDTLTTAAVNGEDGSGGDEDDDALTFSNDDDDDDINGTGAGTRYKSTTEINQLVRDLVKLTCANLMRQDVLSPLEERQIIERNWDTLAAHILNEITRLIQTGSRRTQRSIAYALCKYVPMESMRYCLNKIAKKIGVNLFQLNIIPSAYSTMASGSIVASKDFRLSFDDGEAISYGYIRNVREVYVIPNFLSAFWKLNQEPPDDFDPEENRSLDDMPKATIETVGNFKATWILTFEKSEPMALLARQGILDEEEGIIMICTHGNVSHNILACVKTLTNFFPQATVCHCGDLSPIGIEIMSRFLYMRTTEEDYSVNVQWLYPLPSDVFGDDDEASSIRSALSTAGNCLSGSPHEQQAYNRVKDSRFILKSPERVRQLQMIAKEDMMYQMNNFHLGLENGNLRDFVLNRLRNKEYI